MIEKMNTYLAYIDR